MRPILSLALALVLACYARSAGAAENLIKDPGFERPAPPAGTYAVYQPGQTVGAWTVVGNGNVALTSTTDMNGSFRFDARSGQGFMDLTGNCDCGAASGVAQTVPTVPGNTYQLTFWVGNAYIPSQGTTSTINVYLGSSLLFSAENIRGASLDHQVWQKFSTAFVASGTSAVLSFINGDPDGDLMNGLDDVQLTETAGAHGFSTLYTFTGGTDGSTPNGGLALSDAGQFYGTTYGGGTDRDGTIFSFDPVANQLTTLYQFTGHADGAEPAMKLAVGADGSLFGATQYGGAANSGTVFKFDPGTGGLTTLYAFQGGSDGAEPGGGLLIDNSGYLEGFAHSGGVYNFGDIFQVNPATLTERILHSFRGGAGGNSPSLIVFNSAGLIYGPTGKGGGGSDAGTLFSVNPATGKTRTLYKFTGGSDGRTPTGGFAFDDVGNIYGTTLGGGSANAGTIFAFNAAKSALTTLYNFAGGADGSAPRGGIVFDSAGNLYGTTLKTNGAVNSGTLFRLSPSTGRLVTLHSFSDAADGATPNPDLVVDQSGAIYGTTSVGGTDGFGTIFKFTP